MSSILPITVVIPVGPLPEHKQWLVQALESVALQTYPPDQILLIDDMAGLPPNIAYPSMIPIDIWRSPWRLGVGHAFNFGVALSTNDLVFMMGADDLLHPQCLEQCVKAYQDDDGDQSLGYYWVGVQYLATGVGQQLPCNAAMVSKQLWRRSGGFPVESVTAPDAAFVSMSMVHPQVARMVAVNKDIPLYYYRDHPHTDTHLHGPWYEVIIKTRDLLTRNWQSPEWGRQDGEGWVQ